MKVERIKISDDTLMSVYGVDTMEEVNTIIEEQKKIWCSCGAPKGSYYVADNVDPELPKHHWKCKCCNKPTQIG